MCDKRSIRDPPAKTADELFEEKITLDRKKRRETTNLLEDSFR